MTSIHNHKCKCSKCGSVCARADLGDHFHAKGEGKFATTCKPCCRADRLAYRASAKGAAATKKTNAKYYKANNKERCNRQREYYQQNKPEIQAKQRMHCSTAEGKAAKIITGAPGRGLAAIFDDVKCALIPDKPCYLCGVKPAAGEVWGLDRVDNDEGYIKGNITTCCGTCNYAKHHFPLVHFLKHVVEMDAHLNKQQ